MITWVLIWLACLLFTAALALYDLYDEARSWEERGLTPLEAELIAAVAEASGNDWKLDEPKERLQQASTEEFTLCLSSAS